MEAYSVHLCLAANTDSVMYAAAANLVCCFEIMMSMQERLANASKLEEFFVGKDYNSSLALSHWLQSYSPMS